MKAFILASAVGLFFAQSVIADWVIVSKGTAAGREITTTISLKGNLARMDANKEMSMIMGGDNGGAKMALHAQKKVMVLDAAKLKAIGEMASKFSGGGATPADQKLVATGQKEKIGEWDCDVYTWKAPMGEIKLWLAPNFPNFKDILAAQEKMTKAVSPAMAASMPKAGEIPGMVIKTESKMMGQTSTTQLVSAKEEDLPDSTFELPADYTEMAMPGLPGAGGGN